MMFDEIKFIWSADENQEKKIFWEVSCNLNTCEKYRSFDEIRTLAS